MDVSMALYGNGSHTSALGQLGHPKSLDTSASKRLHALQQATPRWTKEDVIDSWELTWKQQSEESSTDELEFTCQKVNVDMNLASMFFTGSARSGFEVEMTLDSVWFSGRPSTTWVESWLSALAEQAARQTEAIYYQDASPIRMTETDLPKIPSEPLTKASEDSCLAETPVPSKDPDWTLVPSKDPDWQTVCMSFDGLSSLLRRSTQNMELADARQVHYLAISSGLDSDAIIGSQLINMFTSFQCLPEAKQVFLKIFEPDLSAWIAIISAYSTFKQDEEVIRIYQQMSKSSIEPDALVFDRVLQACSNNFALKQGLCIHRQVVANGLESDKLVASSLIQMYTKCGNLRVASTMLAKLPIQDGVTWNALIVAYLQHNQVQQALSIIKLMLDKGLRPGQLALIRTLKACSTATTVEEGRLIHELLVEMGLEADPYIGSALVHMYAKAGDLTMAYMAFERLGNRDIVTWSALIAGYAQHKCSVEALKLFMQMQCEGLQPDSTIFSLIFKACSYSASLVMGRQIHSWVIECGFESDAYVSSTLVDMYTNHGYTEDAYSVFSRSKTHNVVIWSSLIAGYAHNEQGHEALDLFQEMQQAGIQSNPVTFGCVLKACSSITALEKGRVLHSWIVENNFSTHTFLSISLIDMYVKCGSLQDACFVFKSISRPDVVAWSVLIAGYAQHEQGHNALRLFQQMMKEGVVPDSTAFVSTLKACSTTAALSHGRQANTHIVQSGFDSDVFISSALIDMYSSCGCLPEARVVFDKLTRRTVVTWNSMISCYAQHVRYSSAFGAFQEMQQADARPDSVTFLCLLSACRNASLVDEGYELLTMMKQQYHIAPTLEHFNSLVDLLGHARCWSQAEDMLETIPIPNNVVGWISLLSACRMHANLDLGKRCFDYVISLDHEHGGAYVLMYQIYAHAGLYDDAKRLDSIRKYANRWKKPAKCFVEVNDKVHEFTVGDTGHSQSDAIYGKIRSLYVQLKRAGYRPRLDWILDPVSSESKEDILCGHCEKLAIAFGLISTPQGTTIRVTKNLRMCTDCHTAIKLISKIERREIIVKDICCIHQFQKGLCSCDMPQGS